METCLHPVAYLGRLTAYAYYAPWRYAGITIGAALIGLVGSEGMVPPAPEEKKA